MLYSFLFIILLGSTFGFQQDMKALFYSNKGHLTSLTVPMIPGEGPVG